MKSQKIKTKIKINRIYGCVQLLSKYCVHFEVNACVLCEHISLNAEEKSSKKVEQYD